MKHPTEYRWGSRRGKPWTDDEVVIARFLRFCGLDSEQIGAILGRSALSVDGKIGYQATERRYYVRAS